MAGTSASVQVPVRRVDRFTGVTNGAGQLVWTFDPPFPTPPVVTAVPLVASGFMVPRLLAVTATQVTLAVLSSAGITVVGIGVLASGQPAAGVPVHAIAVGP